MMKQSNAYIYLWHFYHFLRIYKILFLALNHNVTYIKILINYNNYHKL